MGAAFTHAGRIGEIANVAFLQERLESRPVPQRLPALRRKKGQSY